MGAFIDLVGKKFNRLLVVRRAEKKGKRGAIYWECVCDCGKSHTTSGRSLKTGDTASCGCLFLEVAAEKGRRKKTHGMAETPTYHGWEGMRGRCNRPTNPKYSDYGGRGIKVCERWEKFENFLADMGERPKGMTLDRYPDVDGNYEPGNCRWATQIMQQNNRRDNRRLTFNGMSLTYAQWERETGISQEAIRTRVKAGWATGKILTEPTPAMRRNRKMGIETNQEEFA